MLQNASCIFLIPLRLQHHSKLEFYTECNCDKSLLHWPFKFQIKMTSTNLSLIWLIIWWIVFCDFCRSIFPLFKLKVKREYMYFTYIKLISSCSVSKKSLMDHHWWTVSWRLNLKYSGVTITWTISDAQNKLPSLNRPQIISYCVVHNYIVYSMLVYVCIWTLIQYSIIPLWEWTLGRRILQLDVWLYHTVPLSAQFWEADTVCMVYDNIKILLWYSIQYKKIDGCKWFTVY